MNIRLGIYEIFSRIVPGGFYLVAIVQFLLVTESLKIDWQSISDLSLIASVALLVVCYVLGEAFDRLSLVWFRLFRSKGYSIRSFSAFKERYQDRWNIDFKGSDWPVLIAYIKTRNPDIAGEIERHNAFSIMLRNVSIGLILIAINWLIQFFIARNTMSIVVALIFLILSIFIVQESAKFRGWFYNGILETLLAYRLDLEKHIKPVKATAKGKDAKS